MFISDEKLAEIRNTADIVDIVSARVQLKKTGKDFAGLCPFHTEKTPSFTVSPTKQIFHCFGCGAGGDVFNFLMSYEGIAFPEAVESVARQYGIELPSPGTSDRQKQQISERESLLALNKRVMRFYREILRGSPEGEAGRKYLENRKTTRETVEKFELGYAPDRWDGLSRFMKQTGVPTALAEKAGLIVPRASGSGQYDRFRHRIIFPIFDVTGQVIGFGGRVLDDSKPKYLNSPETPVYSKRRTLYGLNAAREKCRQTQSVFIVEGYFDLIALHQHGITNSVATLGTALTREHVRRLKGYATKTYLVFDSDEAGVKAAQRTTGLFMDEGMDAAVVLLPEGHDPDTFLFEYGPDAFIKAAGKALGLVDFMIENAARRHGLTMEGKVRILSDLTPPLADISDNVARSIFIRHLAERIGVDETAILDKVRDQLEKLPSQPSNTTAGKTEDSSAPEPSMPVNRLESRVIAMMLQYPGILAEIRDRKVLDEFEDNRLKQIGELIIQLYPQRVKTIAELMNCIEDESQRRLVASLCIEEAGWGEASCTLLLTQFSKSRGRRKNDLLNRIRAAEKSDDHELLLRLLTEKQKQMASRT